MFRICFDKYYLINSLMVSLILSHCYFFFPLSFSQDKEQSLGLGNGENGSNCFKRQEDGIVRSPLTIVLNIRDISTRSVFLIYIIIFIFIIHLITYEKGRNYIDGFKYRLCLQYCLSDPYLK